MKGVIFGPKTRISPATRKNLAERLTVAAVRNSTKNIKGLATLGPVPKIPAKMLNTLKGSGVKPAAKIIQKFHCSNQSETVSKLSRLRPVQPR